MSETDQNRGTSCDRGTAPPLQPAETSLRFTRAHNEETGEASCVRFGARPAEQSEPDRRHEQDQPHGDSCATFGTSEN